ncbi:Hypothetical predicted protein [Cloeon dipterum]|uniref:Uncharacterized protein n=1 Tax=Cloeon dipterum TaxID=197152 RepID=A0A8S1DAC8_9INSE|nr:Hypothetical predicted protein [Cloeon dipterum]
MQVDAALAPQLMGQNYYDPRHNQQQKLDFDNLCNIVAITSNQVLVGNQDIKKVIGLIFSHLTPYNVQFTQLTALAQRLHTFNIPLRSHTRVHDRRLRSSLNADFKERAHPIGTAGELA